MEDIRNSIIGIFAKTSLRFKYSGTGFFVDGGLILTCKHVIDDAKVTEGKIRFQITGDSSWHDAEIIFTSDTFEFDIAILKPVNFVGSFSTLPLIQSLQSNGHDFQTFGYPQVGTFHGLHGDGKILGLIRDSLDRDALQLSSGNVTHGYSGCPIWDIENGGVVGMVSSGFDFGLDKKLGDAVFAIPAEVLKNVYPPLDIAKQKIKHQIGHERVYSNLLKIASYADRIYIAQTSAKSINEIFNKLHQLKAQIRNEFILHNKTIMSFNNLLDYPWNEVCDPNTIIEYSSDDWALSSDLNKKNQFIDLLNKSLQTKLNPDVIFDRDETYYYFAPTNNLLSKELPYLSRKRNTSRSVFKGYLKKTENKIGYYRHSAFYGKFLRFDEKWYLEITPHYRFTTNGYKPSRFSSEQLKKIKQMELNPAVLGQIVMWSEYLRKPPDLFTSEYPYLAFDELVSFDIDKAIDDDAWLNHEDSDNQMLEAVKSDINDLPLFKGREI
jgi:hypothetical protein